MDFDKYFFEKKSGDALTLSSKLLRVRLISKNSNNRQFRLLEFREIEIAEPSLRCPLFLSAKALRIMATLNALAFRSLGQRSVA